MRRRERRGKGGRVVSRSLSLTSLAVLALAGAVVGCGGARTNASEPTEVTAVDALVAASEAAEREGRFDEAAAAIERALRLEPRDAALWTRLARVRLGEGRNEQAESLALKATTYAGDDRDLSSAAWAVVQEARVAQGDREGAVEAGRRAGR